MSGSGRSRPAPRLLYLESGNTQALYLREAGRHVLAKNPVRVPKRAQAARRWS